MRSIIEEALIDIMYDVPSTENVSKVVITEQTINEEIEPELYDSEGNLVNESKTSAFTLMKHTSHISCGSVFM